MSVSRKSFILGTATLSLGALLAACSNSSNSGAASANGETISIKHAFGTTEVPVGVTRIASVNWANHDLPLALGIMPVGFAKQTWGLVALMASRGRPSVSSKSTGSSAPSATSSSTRNLVHTSMPERRLGHPLARDDQHRCAGYRQKGRGRDPD